MQNNINSDILAGIDARKYQGAHKVVDKSQKVVQATGVIITGIMTILCLLPFLLIISASFTEEKSITLYGFSLIPRALSVNAYRLIFQNPKQILGSYAVTVGMTVVGTAIGLFIIAMTGYALQRPDFPLRNAISFYIYFTTLFSGGLIPFYLLVTQVLKLKDSYLAVLLPLMMSPWLIILMKNFLKSVPHSITESATIDGAGDFYIFLKIILPTAKPALATVGLFLALSYWNEWYNSMLFLSSKVIYKPLQLFLYNTVNEAKYIRDSAAASNIPVVDIPMESMKMATAVIATGPIIFAYPFVQKYFIQGITIGAVKG
ncbi:ABC-type sugar transport system, permease component [Thermoclostridium stercorarium subsp. stercorarium DSM 8532]|jgi:putative aldouronate transport system permease protein|uniref:ABC-type sugar transport system, permease component n=3 Tax=Thermoclostridium stercorarium TaxID=1510 RepID=L7VLB0_THES1|nr:carbohydrate ABC transporter permease [Thermoclostridium stercorarium]AGC67266.1 ABC-type sugar transport system, permease component [Thermoclostridium stercorarium subsp. stercorarium DSM 8532]AGI38335.1 ABC transporter permease subunit [Thermoclostridium stercorarium subsp. stercorarium DSM 8532]ANW97771.1 sugar ABC transporter permease [Thermoclostridium stercorarium subsp. thermolacticum DSM 2910]ANX00298.1 sugar ABC transporter permease [Thermoclostridium stercorarium subsp. leptospartu